MVSGAGPVKANTSPKLGAVFLGTTGVGVGGTIGVTDETFSTGLGFDSGSTLQRTWTARFETNAGLDATLETDALLIGLMAAKDIVVAEAMAAAVFMMT